MAGPYGLPPTPARRALFIVYQTAVPYLAERIRLTLAFSFSISNKLYISLSYHCRLALCLCIMSFPICWLCSSRIASRAIVLAESQSDELYGENTFQSSHFQTSAEGEHPSSSTSVASTTTLTRLKEKLSGLWLHVVQRWPTVR